MLTATLAVTLAGSPARAGKPKPPPPQPDFRYDIMFLEESPGATSSVPLAVNNDGIILGRSNGPVLWIPGGGFVHLQDLIDPATGWVLFNANDINNADQIAATIVRYDEDGQFLEADVVRLTLPGAGETYATLTRLNTPWQLGLGTQGFGINENGDVFGNLVSGLLWTPEDGIVDIGSLFPSSWQSLAISDRDASGRIDLVNGSQYRARYTVGSHAAGELEIVIEDLGFIYDDSSNDNPGHSHLLTINSFGLIGAWTTSGPTLETAALYSDATGWRDLGTLAPARAKSWNDSRVTALNNTGLVVGRSLNGGSWPRNVYELTFLWSAAFGMVDLLTYVDGMPPNSDPEALGSPSAVNDNGWICGTSQWGPYVLIPKPAN